MALRMVTYKVLFYEDLVRRGALTERGTLPPLLSSVLYNKSRPWKAARSLEQLVEPLPGYEGLAQPEAFSLLDYRLIEERAYSLSELDRDPDPVSTLFRLEKSRNLEELRQGVQQLAKTIPGAEDDRLREAFATWLTTVLIPSMEPGGEISEIRDLTEVDSMLQQSVIEWRDGWFEDGWKKGLQEGRQEGRQEGEAVLFLRLVEKKFGVVSEDFRAKIESARSEQLLEWTDRILTARRLDQVFED